MNDIYIALHGTTFRRYKTPGGARRWLVKQGGGSIYLITHHAHTNEEGTEMLPQSRLFEEVKT